MKAHEKSDFEALVERGVLRFGGDTQGLDAQMVGWTLWVLCRQRWGSPEQQGGGRETLKLKALVSVPEGWKVSFLYRADYDGTNPAFDPPWCRMVHVEALFWDDLHRLLTFEVLEEGCWEPH